MSHETLILPAVFVIALLLALAIYWVGGRYSVKGKRSRGKLSPYSCGEDLPHKGELRVNLEQFIIYAVYFLIFDVVAFTLTISFKISIAHAIIYALITLASTIFVIKR